MKSESDFQTLSSKPVGRERIRSRIYWAIWDFKRRNKDRLARVCIRFTCWLFGTRPARYKISIDGYSVALGWLSVELDLANSAEWNGLTAQLLQERDVRLGLAESFDVLRDSEGNEIPVPDGGRASDAVPQPVELGRLLDLEHQDTLQALRQVAETARALLGNHELEVEPPKRRKLRKALDHLDACDGGRANDAAPTVRSY